MNTSNAGESIEKNIELAHPVSRVWRALTDQLEFAEWFQASLDKPFAVGSTVHGRVEDVNGTTLLVEMEIREMTVEHRLVFAWHPHADDPERVHKEEPGTVVEFRLAPFGRGTMLYLTESGFERLGDCCHCEDYNTHEAAWTMKLLNLDRFLRNAGRLMSTQAAT